MRMGSRHVFLSYCEELVNCRQWQEDDDDDDDDDDDEDLLLCV